VQNGARLGKGGRRLSFCYEAGPCGYGLHRLLTGRGHSCIVVAPSLIPMKSGDRVKTDRRDPVMLAKLHRAGELTAIWIPDAAHEAMRDLVRARATAGRVLAQARQHLQGFLLRHDRIYRGPRAWTLAYRRWLTTVRFDHPAQQIVLQDYIHAVEDAEARRDRLTRQIEELLPSWSMAPVVEALQAMRGVALVVAVTIVAEVGDFRRFANARQLMAYLGLMSESAWNKDPVFGVIGIQSGPPGRRVHSGFRGGYGGQVGDAGSGNDREDPSGVFRPEQADQDDLPRVSGVAKGRAQGDPVAGDRVSL
jgi:transposase